MNGEDRDLGMDRAISRRDFVNGVAVTAGAAAALASSPALAETATGDARTAANYPPMRHGFRGDHPSSYQDVPAMRRVMGQPPEALAAVDTGESYDLVVVGGGISGLSAAYYYRERAGAAARILVLDNHDDFGGHAKRNEYSYQGKTYIAAGGSDYFVAPASWTYECKAMLKKLDIDVTARSSRGGRRQGMAPATFFRKEAFGRDQLVIGGAPARPTPEFLAQAPLDATVKADLVRLTSDARIDYLPGLSVEDKIARLQAMSYRDYLLNVAKIHPDVLKLSNYGVWCMGSDAVTAWFAYFRHQTGFAGLGVPRPTRTIPETPDNDFEFPAGNSDLCRLIVRALIPDALPPGTWQEVETRQIDYATLDRAQPTRIRLNSTVVRAVHVGTLPHQFEPDNREVEVTYIKDGKACKVRAKDVVMAGYNAMIPYICTELPDEQKKALHLAVRAVNQQTNVLFRNWEAFSKLKVGSIAYPQAFYDSIGLGSGAYGESSADPSQPVLVTYGGGSGILAHEGMTRELTNNALPKPGMPIRDQLRLLRSGLLKMPFEHFERAIRTQAATALAGTGFDPARDILDITLNRWGHGFILGRNHLWDDESGPAPAIVGHKKFGHITIANSDASGIDNCQTAMDEAFRAVRELEPRLYGYFESI